MREHTSFSQRHHARVTGIGGDHGDMTTTTAPIWRTDSLKVVLHRSRGRVAAMFWLLIKRSKQKYVPGLLLSYADITSRVLSNKYFHAWEINTVVRPRRGRPLLSETLANSGRSIYDAWRSLVRGTITCSHNSVVVIRLGAFAGCDATNFSIMRKIQR